ncbi:ATP-dependent protease LonB [Candidatus Woesearchaeota archaeon]|nr:ATP-dependent protease LonB [Candidatus Woesearchaeota archaeon]
MAKKSAEKELNFKSTDEIKIPKDLIDQIIGQDEAVEVMRKAAKRRRHVLLIGEPGTGKSLLGLALAKMLPKEKLQDVVSFANPNDENTPLIRVLPAGKGRELVMKSRMESGDVFKFQNLFMLVMLIFAMVSPWWAFNYYQKYSATVAAIMFVAFFLGSMLFIGLFMLIINLGRKTMIQKKGGNPKVIVDNFDNKSAPFYDATGAHAGALLGDVLHDPFQSGGLGTPANERVMAGMIHKAHMGVLFIDEMSTLQPTTQQELLTALQEGKFSITGQSERSAGAMVRTEPVPCNFIMVAAGNLEAIKNMHPALRSRIRGYGYEVFMKETMEDTIENRNKLYRFIAQEVHKDKNLHFSKDAADVIIHEARKRANRKGHLTLRLRSLGGLIRAAADVAREDNVKYVQPEHIKRAKSIARSLESQISDRYLERTKEYEVIKTSGSVIGRVNGLAVMGDSESLSGTVTAIEAEVTSGGKVPEVIATGKLGDIAKESVKNVSAIVKKYFGDDIIGTKDVYIQFVQEYGVDGDSASIAIATAIISALKNVPIKQNYAMTGSLSIRGEVLAIGGVSAKIEAAATAGIKNVIVPKSNMSDIVLDKSTLSKVNIFPVQRIEEVLKEIIDWKGKKAILDKVLNYK